MGISELPGPVRKDGVRNDMSGRRNMGIPDSKWDAFKRYVSSLPLDVLQQIQRESTAEAERLHGEFEESFAKGLCDSCGRALTSFVPEDSCFHWLLRPTGVKKHHIASVFQARGYFRTASYIRWVCNQGVHIARINDLSEEGYPGAIFHWSAEYSHIRWTFLCTPNDYEGHQDRQASFPHYHLEMRLHDQVFIKFNDFHLNFTHEDLVSLRCAMDPSCPITGTFGPHGSGMEDAFSIPAESILEASRINGDPEKAVYHIQTLLSDEKGISGDVIADALKKSKESGQPVAVFLRELGYRPTVYIEPAEAVPDKQTRPHPRKPKKG
jgi:hypothetical protein